VTSARRIRVASGILFSKSNCADKGKCAPTVAAAIRAPLTNYLSKESFGSRLGEERWQTLAATVLW